MLQRNTIIPIDAHDDKIRFVFLGNYFGHCDIIVKSARTGNVEAFVTNAIELAEKDPIFPYPVVEIEKLPEGAYYVYSTDHNHTEASYSAFVTLSGDSTSKLLETCSQVSHAEAGGILEAVKNKIPDGLESLLYLRSLYVQEEDDEKKISLAKLLIGAVSFVNARMQGGQILRDGEYSVADETLLAELNCAHILRKDVLTNEVQQCTPFSEIGETNMPEEDDHLYLYAEIDGSGVPIGFLLSYRLDPIVYGILKEDAMYGQNLYESAIEKANSMPLEGIEFSAAEKPFLAVLEELWPDGPYLHAPVLAVSSGELIAEFEEDDKKILSLFPDNYYLAVNPVDIALDPTQRIRVQIPGRDFAVYSYKLNLGSEDCAYWIEDELGHVVSDIKMLRMKNDYLAQIAADSEKTENLNTRIGKLFFEKYKKHLLPFVKARDASFTDFVHDALAYCEAKSYNVQDIAHAIIEHAIESGKQRTATDLAATIMKDKVVYGAYATNFFRDNPVYKERNFTLAMPPESDVLYKIELYSYENGRHVEYFKSNAHEAVDYHMYDCDFAVFTAIDVASGKSSGFLLFDFGYGQRESTRITKFLLDVKEVEA